METWRSWRSAVSHSLLDSSTPIHSYDIHTPHTTEGNLGHDLFSANLRELSAGVGVSLFPATDGNPGIHSFGVVYDVAPSKVLLDKGGKYAAKLLATIVFTALMVSGFRFTHVLCMGKETRNILLALRELGRRGKPRPHSFPKDTSQRGERDYAPMRLPVQLDLGLPAECLVWATDAAGLYREDVHHRVVSNIARAFARMAGWCGTVGTVEEKKARATDLYTRWRASLPPSHPMLEKVLVIYPTTSGKSLRDTCISTRRVGARTGTGVARRRRRRRPGHREKSEEPERSAARGRFRRKARKEMPGQWKNR